ncbi:MAG: GntR family transcriptional regulator [Thiohalocapsa sp. PB-PSB1]|nr:MAG: hypothetical protein N838_25595 [Thiohalocapsa sp. PB-PSB1]QQO57287.1 MAG: GntR family transcriptional regulator [Thiohalocapsa sp. PB-PSB1]
MEDTLAQTETRRKRENAEGQKPIWRIAKEHLLSRVRELDSGDSLPTYAELANELDCSPAPVKQAFRELAAEGWISVQRGRPAKVLWTGSFSRSARRAGHELVTRAFQKAYRPLEKSESAIAEEFGLSHDQPCIVCGRVRHIDGQAAALSTAYINPVFFVDPSRFFLDHDVEAGSLRDIYATLGVRPIRIPAILKPAMANEQERALLKTPEYTPVLRVHQEVVVDWRGSVHVLEVMNATYTAAIDYRVDRLPEWNMEKLGHVHAETN